MYLPVEDPVLYAVVRRIRLIASLMPIAFDLAEQAILVLLRALLDLLSTGAEIAGELICIPLVVRLGHVILPVVLNQILKVLAVRRCRIWDVVI